MSSEETRPSTPLKLRVGIPVMRLAVRILKFLGLREHVLRWRVSRARKRRRAAEARGDDSLSKPGLHQMDMKLNAIIDIDGGFFIEAGANDGFTQSNTYWLERFRGWRGILIDPMAAYAQACREERPDAIVVQAALVPADFEGDTVEMVFGDLMSAIGGTHEDDDAWVEPGLTLGWFDPYRDTVPARTLSAVLDAAGAPEIDLLSLDVEGYEAEVLRGLDLKRHAPRWILVEMHDLEEGRKRIGAILGKRYTEHSAISPLDVLYQRKN
jgi:FkbM family methyltransferase